MGCVLLGEEDALDGWIGYGWNNHRHHHRRSQSLPISLVSLPAVALPAVSLPVLTINTSSPRSRYRHAPP